MIFLSMIKDMVLMFSIAGVFSAYSAEAISDEQEYCASLISQDRQGLKKKCLSLSLPVKVFGEDVLASNEKIVEALLFYIKVEDDLAVLMDDAMRARIQNAAVDFVEKSMDAMLLLSTLRREPVFLKLDLLFRNMNAHAGLFKEKISAKVFDEDLSLRTLDSLSTIRHFLLRFYQARFGLEKMRFFLPLSFLHMDVPGGAERMKDAFEVCLPLVFEESRPHVGTRCRFL